MNEDFLDSAGLDDLLAGIDDELPEIDDDQANQLLVELGLAPLSSTSAQSPSDTNDDGVERRPPKQNLEKNDPGNRDTVEAARTDSSSGDSTTDGVAVVAADASSMLVKRPKARPSKRPTIASSPASADKKTKQLAAASKSRPTMLANNSAETGPSNGSHLNRLQAPSSTNDFVSQVDSSIAPVSLAPAVTSSSSSSSSSASRSTNPFADPPQGGSNNSTNPVDASSTSILMFPQSNAVPIDVAGSPDAPKGVLAVDHEKNVDQVPLETTLDSLLGESSEDVDASVVDAPHQGKGLEGSRELERPRSLTDIVGVASAASSSRDPPALPATGTDDEEHHLLHHDSTVDNSAETTSNQSGKSNGKRSNQLTRSFVLSIDEQDMASSRPSSSSRTASHRSGVVANLFGEDSKSMSSTIGVSAEAFAGNQTTAVAATESGGESFPSRAGGEPSKDSLNDGAVSGRVDDDYGDIAEGPVDRALLQRILNDDVEDLDLSPLDLEEGSDSLLSATAIAETGIADEPHDSTTSPDTQSKIVVVTIPNPNRRVRSTTTAVQRKAQVEADGSAVAALSELEPLSASVRKVKPDAGFPVALAVARDAAGPSSVSAAIGTTRGSCILFSASMREPAKLVLPALRLTEPTGTSPRFSPAAPQGPAAALDIVVGHQDSGTGEASTMVAVGYQSGAVAIWHPERDSLLPSCALPPGSKLAAGFSGHSSAVVHVAFVGQRGTTPAFLTGDVSGVLLLRMCKRHRGLRRRRGRDPRADNGFMDLETAPVLDGSAGMVLALAALRVSPGVPPPLGSWDHRFVAFSTRDRTHVVSLHVRPEARVRYSRLPRPANVRCVADAVPSMHPPGDGSHLLPGSSPVKSRPSSPAASRSSTLTSPPSPLPSASAMGSKAGLAAAPSDDGYDFPCLAWRTLSPDEVPMAHNKGRYSHPCLAIGWGHEVQLIQIVSEREFVTVGRYGTRGHARVHACAWLGGQALALLVGRPDRVVVVDPYALRQLQAIPIGRLELVCHNRFGEAAAAAVAEGAGALLDQTAGHRRRRRQSAAQHLALAYSRTLVAGCDGRVHLLGMQSVHQLRLLPWDTRIDRFAAVGKYLAAIELGQLFFDGAAPCTVGLPSDPSVARQVISDRVRDLVQTHFDHCVRTLGLTQSQPIQTRDLGSQGSGPNGHHRIRTLAHECLSAYLHVEETGLHLTELFRMFDRLGHASTFLDVLQATMLRNELRRLSPELLQVFVEHYAATGDPVVLQRVEQCVCKLDLSCVDFQQVVLVCRKYQLFSGLYYLFSRALGDYVSPVRDTLEWLANMTDKSSPGAAADRVGVTSSADRGAATDPAVDIFDRVASGQWTVKAQQQLALAKLLQFLNRVLVGRAFPRGVIAPDRIDNVRKEIHRALFDEGPFGNYRYMRAMILLNASDTLDSLKLFFDPAGNAMVAAAAAAAGANADSTSPRHHAGSPQRSHGQDLVSSQVTLTTFDLGHCVQILTRIMLHTDMNPFALPPGVSTAARAPFTARKLGVLFEFICQYIVQGKLDLSVEMFDHLLAHLVCTRDPRTARDRQSALLMMLPQLPEGSEHTSDSNLLSLAELAEFHRVAELLHAKRRDFKGVVRSRLRDPDTRHEAFALIRSLLNDSSLSEQERGAVKSTAIAVMRQLIELDSGQASRLVNDCFRGDHDDVVSQLESHRTLQYHYLQALVGTSDEGTSHDGADDDAVESALSPRIRGDARQTHSGAVPVAPHLVQLYVELLCEYEPSGVVAFLRSHDNVQLDQCLQLCRRHGIRDAVLYLLERTGDILEALAIICRDVERGAQVLRVEFRRNVAESPLVNRRGTSRQPGRRGTADQPSVAESPAIDADDDDNKCRDAEMKLQQDLLLGVQLCQRAVSRLNADELAGAWFALLDSLARPLRDLKQGANNAAQLSKRITMRLQKFDPSVLQYGDLSSASLSVPAGPNSGGVALHKLSPSKRARVNTSSDAEAADVAWGSALTACLHVVLSSMLGHVAMPLMLQRIVRDHGSHEFGEFKAVIVGMLESYQYEKSILATVKRLLDRDVWAAHDKLTLARQLAFAAHSTKCDLCGKSFLSNDSVAVNRCSHLFHRRCLKGARGCVICRRALQRKRAIRRAALEDADKTEADELLRPAGATSVNLEPVSAVLDQFPDQGKQDAAGGTSYAESHEEYLARHADFLEIDRRRFQTLQLIS